MTHPPAPPASTPAKPSPSSTGLHRTARHVEKRALRAIAGLVNGIEWLRSEPTDVVDRTPFDVVFQHDKLSVRRYRPLAHDDAWPLGTTVLPVDVPRRSVPVLLIPPLMVRPFVYDLTRRRSLVRTLLHAGFDVFLVDFGEPGRDDHGVTLDRYVLDWVPRAVDATCEAAGTNALSLYGYCMGGLFALMHASVHRDPRVRALVTIGSPVDAHKMGVLAWMVRTSHVQIDFLTRKLGNVPGPISSTVFQLTNPWRSVTRYGDLFLNLWNDDYVTGFDGVTAWTGGFIDYPGSAFRQLLADFLKENKLKDGRMAFGGRVADLAAITCPVLAFAGRTDRIVPPAAARELLEVVGSADKTFIEAPGGHMGVFGGREAPRRVWAESVRWLAERTS